MESTPGEFMTIGEFARASRLSAKALRHYDELGLLIPARVDPLTGYRFYTPDQLPSARLIVWLRRLGMPLARIRFVCELTPSAAADEVSAFWSEFEIAGRSSPGAGIVPGSVSVSGGTRDGAVTHVAIRRAH